MKDYETRAIPASTHEVCVRRRCDLCGAESKDDEWPVKGSYNFAETTVQVTVESRTGENYPSGGSAATYEIDLCPACFRDRLVPWLRSQGAEIAESVTDW